MKRYYYLVSSLTELSLDPEDRPISMDGFLDFCKEELSREDYHDLRRLFLLNDIKNTVSYHKSGDTYIKPAFYLEDKFIENLSNPEKIFPFIQRFLTNQASGLREYPDLKEDDELAQFFYEELELGTSRFHRDYYQFELNLRNISTAYSLRSQGLPYISRLIPSGSVYESIIRSSQPDFGLGSEVDYIKELSALFDNTQAVKLERAMDMVRWNWLDEFTERDFFSLEAVYAYAIKLTLLNRWAGLSVEKGEEQFERLVAIIKRSVRFSIEILTVGDKK